MKSIVTSLFILVFLSTAMDCITYAGGPCDNHDNQLNMDRSNIENIVKHSDIVAVGKTESLDTGVRIGKGDGKTPGFSSCTLDIEQVLKGSKDLKTVLIAMKPFVQVGKNWYEWDSPLYVGGTRGVWFLSKEPSTVPEEVIKYLQNKGDYYFIYKFNRFDENLINLVEDITTDFKGQQKQAN